MNAQGSHYFDEEPTTESDPREVSLLLPDGSLRLMTDRGVFGYDRIDPGTKLLLLKAPPLPDRGDVLDLGCGTGAIALTMARRAPHATVWAVDVNERARSLTRANAELNSISNVVVAASASSFASFRKPRARSVGGNALSVSAFCRNDSSSLNTMRSRGSLICLATSV